MPCHNSLHTGGKKIWSIMKIKNEHMMLEYNILRTTMHKENQEISICLNGGLFTEINDTTHFCVNSVMLIPSSFEFCCRHLVDHVPLGQRKHILSKLQCPLGFRGRAY